MQMPRGNFMVVIALFGYIPFVVCLFAMLRPRTAVIWSFLVAWLFLPMSSIPIHGITNYNKMSAACFGVLVATVIFNLDVILAFRPNLWDIPMFVFCLCPFVSSYFNDLGPYDGVVAIAYQTTSWGLPYFIGRLYFNDLVGLRELALGIVAGGLIYVPLCWFEIRFSPQLHMWLYGYYQYEFGQSRRYGGFRPMVFMQHGLAVAMWMITATIVAFWLWRSKTISRVLGIPIATAFWVLFITSAAIHSVGAIFLLGLGMVLLELVLRTKSYAWILLFALVPSVYMTLRITNLWTGEDFITSLRKVDDRSANSLGVRFENEKLLIRQALKQPIYGWAGWDRFRDTDAHGNSIGVPDQLYVIMLGHFGFEGLVLFTFVLTGPLLLLAARIPVRYWAHPGAAPAAALAVLLGLHMCDNLFNAMVNPIFILCAGGLNGLTFKLQKPAITQPGRNYFQKPRRKLPEVDLGGPPLIA